MIAYTVRRLLIGIPVLIAATMFVFLLVALSGDPRDPLLVRNPPVTQSTLDEIDARLHLDDSLPERYWW